MSTLILTREIPEYFAEGKRLGRHVEHDSRSRDFEFTALAATSSPASVRHARHIPVLNQGNLGSCTGNGAVGAAGTTPVFENVPAGLLPADAIVDEKLAVSVYSVATTLDNVPGQYPPNDTGSSGVAAAKAAVKARLFSGYQHTFSLDAALAALQLGPVMTGVHWYDSFDQPDGDGLVTITPGATVRGGHEFVADEIVADKRLVGFTNSWGTGYGLSGRFYMSWDDWGRLLSEQGDVTVPIPAKGPQPPVPPPATPDQVDRALWAAAGPWAKRRHLCSGRKIAKALLDWAHAKGLT